MSRKFLSIGCAVVVLGALAGGMVAAGPVHHLSQLGGYTNAISSFVDDGQGSISFNIDVNGDLGGSTHDGTVTCPRPVHIVSEQHRDGSGHYDGSVNGNIYTWHTQCSNFAGIHETVQLAY